MPPKFSDGSFTEDFRGTVGYYKYKFRIDGKEHFTYGYSKQECWAKRADKMAGKTNPKKSNKQNFTVGGWMLKYYDTFRRSKGSETVQKENDRYIREIELHFGKIALDKISAEQIQSFINTFDGVSNKRRRIAQFIRSAFKKALALRHIKYNPCEALDAPRHQYKNHPVLQLAEQRLILENIHIPKYKAFFMFCCCTGLRVGEAVNAVIDYKRNVILVTDADTKTKKHKREIPFLPELIDKELLSLIQYKRGVQSYFKNLFEKIGIEAVTHSFRVTFISCCLYLGINPKQIQEWAGHKNFAITIDTYAKLLKKDGSSPILDYLRKLKEQLEL